MANITPPTGAGTASLGSPLITPGYPLASVPMSNPNAAVEVAAGQTDGQETAARQTAKHQSSHDADRVV